MARPRKCRCICSLPRVTAFDPAGRGTERTLPPVTIGYDEYEVLRLLDRERLSQQECAKKMQISRPTVARMYESVRGKLAQALTEGRGIRIAGGDIQVCTGLKPECRNVENCCHRQSPAV
ncbi:MAG TPA: DUF134 domain-containing protein [Firmicutes bacterium]|nr:DUF134 domain-containing protein [Bacillota bacterium]